MTMPYPKVLGPYCQNCGQYGHTACTGIPIGNHVALPGWIPALIAEVRRLREDNERLNRILFHGAGSELAAERDAAVAATVRRAEALQAVRDLHQRQAATGVHEERCAVCHWAESDVWPCAALRALDAALDGAE